MDYREILNKINLREEQILEHLVFLRYFDENPVYLQENILKQAVARYEKYWIPFILNNSPSYETDLEWLPPLDVHWAWHVHMLAPRVYTRDLLGSRLQRIINHRPLDVLGEEAAKKRAKTAAKWGEAFPGVSFEPDLQTLTLNDDFKSPFSYDIISASARQKVFYYQVNIFCNGSWKEQML